MLSAPRSRRLLRPMPMLRQTRAENRWERCRDLYSTAATIAAAVTQPQDPQKRTTAVTGAARRRKATSTASQRTHQNLEPSRRARLWEPIELLLISDSGVGLAGFEPATS